MATVTAAAPRCGGQRPQRLCRLVCDETEYAQRLCTEFGDTEHWLALVDLNDALSAYYRSDKRVYLAARKVGITDDPWRAIKRGG